MATKKNIKKSNIILGKHIQRLRLMQDMSIMQLGRKVNKNKQQITAYERGEGFVPLPVIENIASALGEPVAKKIIRKISFLRKLEAEKKTEMEDELIDLYNEAFPEDESNL